jgi:formamidopyrimidine-DNA glycosylase
MLEIPEAFARSKQLKTVIKGEIVTRVVSNAWPHKLTWFYEDPDAYENRLMGKQVTDVKPLAGLVEIYLQDMRLTLSDGVNIRLISPGEKEPVKHQLLLEFD